MVDITKIIHKDVTDSDIKYNIDESLLEGISDNFQLIIMRVNSAVFSIKDSELRIPFIDKAVLKGADNIGDDDVDIPVGTGKKKKKHLIREMVSNATSQYHNNYSTTAAEIGEAIKEFIPRGYSAWNGSYTMMHVPTAMNASMSISDMVLGMSEDTACQKAIKYALAYDCKMHRVKGKYVCNTSEVPFAVSELLVIPSGVRFSDPLYNRNKDEIDRVLARLREEFVSNGAEKVNEVISELNELKVEINEWRKKVGTGIYAAHIISRVYTTMSYLINDVGNVIIGSIFASGKIENVQPMYARMVELVREINKDTADLEYRVSVDGGFAGTARPDRDINRVMISYIRSTFMCSSKDEMMNTLNIVYNNFTKSSSVNVPWQASDEIQLILSHRNNRIDDIDDLFPVIRTVIEMGLKYASTDDEVISIYKCINNCYNKGYKKALERSGLKNFFENVLWSNAVHIRENINQEHYKFNNMVDLEKGCVNYPMSSVDFMDYAIYGVTPETRSKMGSVYFTEDDIDRGVSQIRNAFRVSVTLKKMGYNVNNINLVYPNPTDSPTVITELHKAFEIMGGVAFECNPDASNGVLCNPIVLTEELYNFINKNPDVITVSDGGLFNHLIDIENTGYSENLNSNRFRFGGVTRFASGEGEITFNGELVTESFIKYTVEPLTIIGGAPSVAIINSIIANKKIKRGKIRGIVNTLNRDRDTIFTSYLSWYVNHHKIQFDGTEAQSKQICEDAWAELNINHYLDAAFDACRKVIARVGIDPGIYESEITALKRQIEHDGYIACKGIETLRCMHGEYQVLCRSMGDAVIKDQQARLKHRFPIFEQYKDIVSKRRQFILACFGPGLLSSTYESGRIRMMYRLFSVGAAVPEFLNRDLLDDLSVDFSCYDIKQGNTNFDSDYNFEALVGLIIDSKFDNLLAGAYNYSVENSDDVGIRSTSSTERMKDILDFLLKLDDLVRPYNPNAVIMIMNILVASVMGRDIDPSKTNSVSFLGTSMEHIVRILCNSGDCMAGVPSLKANIKLLREYINIIKSRYSEGDISAMMVELAMLGCVDMD